MPKFHKNKNVHSIVNMRLFTGIIIIAVGILFFFKNMGYLQDVTLWHYWPVLLIMIGLVHLFSPHPYRKVISGSVLIVLGVVLILKYQGIFFVEWKLVWPILIVFGGIVMLANSVKKNHGKNRIRKSVINSNMLDIQAIFGGGDFQNSSDKFQGGRITAVFGGCKVDLRKAKIKGEETEINIFAMWGGASLIVPENWEVVVHSSAIIGGIDNLTRFQRDENDEKKNKKLVITGSAIMGGVEIKN